MAPIRPVKLPSVRRRSVKSQEVLSKAAACFHIPSMAPAALRTSFKGRETNRSIAPMFESYAARYSSIFPSIACAWTSPPWARTFSLASASLPLSLPARDLTAVNSALKRWYCSRGDLPLLKTSCVFFKTPAALIRSSAPAARTSRLMPISLPDLSAMPTASWMGDFTISHPPRLTMAALASARPLPFKSPASQPLKPLAAPFMSPSSKASRAWLMLSSPSSAGLWPCHPPFSRAALAEASSSPIRLKRRCSSLPSAAFFKSRLITNSIAASLRTTTPFIPFS